jgi:RNA polymerase sigma-70 factor (ECF subfamily)
MSTKSKLTLVGFITREDAVASFPNEVRTVQEVEDFEFAGTPREWEFERLKQFITGEQPKLTYRDVAAQVGMSEAAIKSSVHRLRQRFGALLREAIAETVGTPDEVDDEVRHLLGVIAPWGPSSS